MERLGSIPPPHAAQTVAGAVIQGKGWAVLPEGGAFIIRALVSGSQVRLSARDVADLREGATTAEALLARAGIVLTKQARAITGKVLLNGSGFTVFDTKDGPVLRATASKAEVPITDAQVRSLGRGEVGAETLLNRAGLSLNPGAPHAPIYGTSVAFSPEARRLAGRSKVDEEDRTAKAGGAGRKQGAGGKGQMPAVSPTMIVAGGLLLLLLLGWMTGVFG